MRRLMLLIVTIAIVIIPLLAQEATVAQVLVHSATDTEEPQFQVLLAAALESDVLTILEDSDAEITVFAPTDEAFFSAIEAMGISYSELTSDTSRLIALLTYHIVSGRYTADDLAAQNTLNTLYSDTSLSVDATGGTITLDDTATIIESDIEAANGIIHTIDTVLLPPQSPDTVSTETGESLADIVSSREDLSLIWTVLESAGFSNALMQGDIDMTLFLPTNEALEAANLSTADLGIDEIAYHSIEGVLLLEDLVNFDNLLTQQGEDIAVTVTVTDDSILLNNEAVIIEGDIIASNGVLHIIDRPLIVPSSLPDAEATEEADD